MTTTGAPPPTQADAPRWLSPNQIAADLSVSKMTVYRLVESGDLPAVRVGRNVRIRASAYEAYLRSCRIVPTDPTT